jgi:hypothetical protein
MMTADELRRSLEARQYARHSNAMEGLYETPEESALLDAVARGEIDGDEYRRRVMERIERENRARNQARKPI